MAEEVVLDQVPTTRGQPVSSGLLDLSCDVDPGVATILAIRHPSNALTFHLPAQSTSRGRRGPSQARFQIPLRRIATRGLASQAIKVIVVKVAELAGDRLVSLVLPKLVAAFEKHTWKKRGLKEGWLRVTKDTLAAGALAPGAPVSPERSLLFIHGTFCDTVSAYRSLASSDFFDRVKGTYSDRIFAFDHFSLSRTPEENGRMLLEGLPEETTLFDVITYSRGGLVLRTVVERASKFGSLARRFRLGRAVLVASPNEGTPLATPNRWDQTVGWLANMLELFPDNPFTTGAAFVANGLVWLANHVSGDIPGLHAMDRHGDPITQIQSSTGPPADAYSALVANYNATGDVLHRLLDVGLDQFFGSANDLVVPAEDGWRIKRSSTIFIPASRIGCFGPGGNLPEDSVSHLSFFSRAATVDFLVNALEGRRQPLKGIDPRKQLPDRRLLRGEAAAPVRSTAGAATPMPARRPARGARKAEKPLHVSVTNGDLTYEADALLIGHYTGTRLTGTEKLMNRLIGGAMEHALQVGLYPLSVGAHQIFINDHTDQERGTLIPRPAAVIVVGLGPEGALKPSDLVTTVRLAVIGWARRLAEHGLQRPNRQFFELASTLLGSGGSGVSAGQATRLIMQGVWEANAVLVDDQEAEDPWPRCTHLRLIEIYLERATEAWQALRLQHAMTPDCFEMDDFVRPGIGALRRPRDSGYRGADYDLITVEATALEHGDSTLEYTLDTRRARSEVHGQRTQSGLVGELVATASNDANRDQQLGRTLFSLLIPVELEAYLADSGDLQMALDPATAAIPWELLDVHRGQDSTELPWAIRVKLLRKLRLDTFREHVIDAGADASTLVIGEPECPPEYPRLEGARNEAIAVNGLLTGRAALAAQRVKLLIGSDPSTPGPNVQSVINALFERPWTIIHITGHGSQGVNGKSGGVVLSNGTFLGPDEIRSMRVVPELVFVNCCHLARGDDDQLLKRRYDRARFASGVAGALIDVGVRCVIAAGWAVDDDAASTFASAFYASLLGGNRFIDAVGDAREVTYKRHAAVNTWAAYQCYGDPDWRFRSNAPDANRAESNAEDLAGMGASATSLRLELDRIVVETRFQGYEPSAQASKLQNLDQRFGERWGTNGAVAELFGQAYAEAGAMECAMKWYERAMNASDGLASMKAVEQLANVCSRFGWETVERALRHRDRMARQQKDASTRSAKAAARAAHAAAEKKLNEAVVAARASIDRALTLLTKLKAFTSTMERESLVASALKRRALVNTAAGQAAGVRRDLVKVKKVYEKAVLAGKAEDGADVYYPASNYLAADLALAADTRARVSLNARILDVVQTYLKAKATVGADFWSVAGDIELAQYQAIAARKLAARRVHLERLYRDLYKRAKSARMWASVYDNAFLVLRSYAGPRSSTSMGEKQAAERLLIMLRTFAHPEDGQ